MELNTEQQAEYDKLFKELVAQGGPLKGQLKAAGHKDPEGVARLVELGWVNPDAEPLTMEGLGFDTSKPGDEQVDEVAAATGGTEIDITNLSEALAVEYCEGSDKLAKAIQAAAEGVASEQDELLISEAEAEEAQEVADEAVRKAAELAEIAESKKPLPCSRCNGDGFWHSNKTGYRAKTSSEPLIDESRTCPKCN